MRETGVSAQQLQSIVDACQGVLINSSILPLDLKQFLAVGLSSRFPDLAARIVQFDDQKMKDLRQEIVAALDRRAGPGTMPPQTSFRTRPSSVS
jgi:hypothetical protein